MERQESTEKFITSSMISFINRTIKSAQLSSLDDIVFNYVATVLESLATETGALEDCFDVEEFCEILSAYFPEFSSIPHPIVSQWIFDMVSTLRESTKKGKSMKEHVAFETLLCEIEPEREPRSKRNSESSSDSSSYCSFNGKKSSVSRTPHVSETSETESDVVDIIQRLQLCQIQNEGKIRTLMEMFPTLLKVDALNYISITNGDLEKAVQMVLLQMENGEIVTTHSAPPTILPGRPRICGAKPLDVDEKTLKDRIVARYGFIDQAEDAKEYRPPPLKAEPKKLVRYRESQVVTTKGERYSEVRGVKDAEDTRSKNYINKASRHN